MSYQQAGPPTSFPFSHQYSSTSSNTTTPTRNHLAVNNNVNFIYDEEYADINMLPSSEHSNPFAQQHYQQQQHSVFSPKTPEMDTSFKETSKMLITPNTFNLNRRNQYLDSNMDLENVDPMTGKTLSSWTATPNKFTPNSHVLQQHSGNIAHNHTFYQNIPMETPRKQKMVCICLLFLLSYITNTNP